jgi:hypothetical protein
MAGKQNAPSGWTGALHGDAERAPGRRARREGEPCSWRTARRGEISPVGANCSWCAERWKGSTRSLRPPFSSACLRVRCDPFRRDGRADSIPGRRGRARPLLGWVPRLSAMSSAIPCEVSRLLRHGGESAPRRRFEHRRGRRSDCYTRPELRGGGVPGGGPRACSVLGSCVALQFVRHR